MRFPTSNGRWRVAHGKDFFADLVRTKNLLFDTDGHIRLNRKPIALYTSNDDSQFGSVLAIVPTDVNTCYVVTSGAVFSANSTFQLTKLTTTGLDTIGVGGDGVYFNGSLHVAGSTTVQNYDGAWHDRVTGLSSSFPHPICAFEDRLELSVGNGNAVQNYNTGYTNNGTSTPFTLTLPAEYVVTSLRWRAGALYIGTRHKFGGSAKLFVWDGAGTTCPVGYDVAAQAIYSIAEYVSSITLITSRGQLLRFNGGGFDELAHFPCYDTGGAWGPVASVATASNDVCSNRGMFAVGSRLYINIQSSVVYDHNMPSGVWCYDPEIGLYHYAGAQHNKYKSLTITGLASSILAVGTHDLATGDPVFAESVSNIAGLTNSLLYYAVVIDATHIQLATTPQDALNGAYLALSGTPSGDTLYVDDTSSFGAVADNTRPGAIGAPTTDTSTTPNRGASFFTSKLIYGASPFDDSGTAIKTLNGTGTYANRASATFSPVPAQAIFDSFQKVYALARDLIYSADEILIKYRFLPRPGLPTPIRSATAGLAVWTSPTTFTLDRAAKFAHAAQSGDEIEIVSGSASGYTATIVSIDTSMPTYIVQVADPMPVATNDKSEIIIEDWITLPASDATADTLSRGYISKGIDKSMPQVQIKMELRGYDPKVRMLDVVQSVDKAPV